MLAIGKPYTTIRFFSSSPPTYIASIRRFGLWTFNDVHLTNMPHLPRSSTTKKLRSCAVPFVLSCQAPCKASFRPLPLGLKLSQVSHLFLFLILSFLRGLSREETNLEIVEPQLLDANTLLLHNDLTMFDLHNSMLVDASCY